MKLVLLAVAIVATPAGAASSVQSISRTGSHGERTMVHTVVIRAPAKDVYRALTTAAGWRRWAVAAAWQVGQKPRVIETSYDPKAKPGGAATIRQLFVREEPYRLVEFRTVKAPSGFEGFETYRNVVNRVELSSLGPRQTRVRFSAGPYPDTPDGRRLYRFFEAGNRKTLKNMAEVLGDHARNRFAEH